MGDKYQICHPFFILQNFSKLFLFYIKLIRSRGELQMMEFLISTYVSDSRCLFQRLTISEMKETAGAGK